jgi:hypothetical protein
MLTEPGRITTPARPPTTLKPGAARLRSDEIIITPVPHVNQHLRRGPVKGVFYTRHWCCTICGVCRVGNGRAAFNVQHWRYGRSFTTRPGRPPTTDHHQPATDRSEREAFFLQFGERRETAGWTPDKSGTAPRFGQNRTVVAT